MSIRIVLLPGLFDMHAHTSSWEGGLHLAAGVTTEQALDLLAAQAPRWATIGAAQTRAVATRLMAT